MISSHMYLDMFLSILYDSEAKLTQKNEVSLRDHRDLQFGILIT
jgi:hypothetical protein